MTYFVHLYSTPLRCSRCLGRKVVRCPQRQSSLPMGMQKPAPIEREEKEEGCGACTLFFLFFSLTAHSHNNDPSRPRRGGSAPRRRSKPARISWPCGSCAGRGRRRR